MLEHTIQHPDSSIKLTSQEILFKIYKNEGFLRVKSLIESLHPQIIQQLVRVIPEAKNIKGI